MKSRSLFTILPLLLLTPALTLAQLPNPSGKSPSAPPPTLSPAEQAAEKPFTLEFEGGLVEKFVAAVEAATKEPFNVIIPDSAKDLKIPPVRAREVTLSRLLTALSASSVQQIALISRQNSVAGGSRAVRDLASNIEYYSTDFRFTPTAGSGGSMVWQLTVNKPPQLPPNPPVPRIPPIARFYQLKPNLETGLKVEDITTVAQTAWKMMELDDVPQLKVHEETGILIAVGSESALQVLDSILRELPKTAKPAADRIPPQPPPGVRPPTVPPQ